MKISLNWLKNHIELNETPEEISSLLTNCGLEVEDCYTVETIRGGLNGLVVGQVMEVKPHPNADRLRLTRVNTGGPEWLNIVCGAPNVAEGQKVVVAPIGTTIYPTGGEPVTMKPAKIRGEISEGMICAEDEIGLGHSHDGILILDPKTEVGAPLKNYVDTGSDVLFEIGLTPNRGDAASHLGVARDLRAVLSRPLKVSEGETVHLPETPSPVMVRIDDPGLCGRYSGLYMKGLSDRPTPEWLSNSLAAIGLNPISLAVDVTNFILMDLGQPMHAFDADKLRGSIQVRPAKKGESLVTLDKVERKLDHNELVIADDSGPIALAGVMGGLSTAISRDTTSIFLESAWFDQAAVRKTAKIHGLSTDSSFRFERGTNPEITVQALLKAAWLIGSASGAKATASVVDVIPQPIEPFAVSFSVAKFTRVTGCDIEQTVLKSIFQNLDINILKESDGNFELEVPRYRSDVSRDIDLFEDVLRIYGYNRIPMPAILHGAAVVQPKPDKNLIRQRISGYLAANGFNEIMTNSLCRETWFEEEENRNAVRLLNPLSNELAILRPAILPSLLEAVSYNKNRKSHDLKFFEFGKTYRTAGEDHKEFEVLALIVTGKKEPANWREKGVEAGYYYLKSVVSNIFGVTGVVKQKGVTLGPVPIALKKKLDVKGDAWFATIQMDALLSGVERNEFKPRPIPVFPEVHRDLNLVIDSQVNYSDIEQLAGRTTGKYLRDLTVTDVFTGKPLEEGKKSYTLHFVLYDSDKTMTDNQIDGIMQKLINTFEQQLNAVVRK